MRLYKEVSGRKYFYIKIKFQRCLKILKMQSPFFPVPFNKKHGKAEYLASQILDFLNQVDELTDDERDVLRVPICRLAFFTVPDIRTKMYEYIVADKSGLMVCQKLTGPDLISKTGRPYESKHSTIYKKTKKCNFMWNLPAGETLYHKRCNLVASAKVKGDALYDITDPKSNIIKSYRLNHKFLMLYFSRVVITEKTEGINFGSTYCHECKTCPRMDKFQELSDKYPNITDEDWDSLYPKLKPHECPNLKFNKVK